MSDTTTNLTPDPETPKEPDVNGWLLTHTIGQLNTVGRLIGVSGVAFLVAAATSVLLNTGASDKATIKLFFVEVEVANAVGVQSLMFLAALGLFVAMMYCFAIFAGLMLSVQKLAERDDRANALADLEKTVASENPGLTSYTKLLRTIIVILSILILLVAFGTYLQSLKG